MVLLKGVSKYFLVFLLLFSFLCPTNIYGAEDSKRTRSVEKGVVTESVVSEETEKSLDWLSGFVEITEEDLYK